ncbi:MAG: SUMF1/EgtB/PvdO family nonheme iron enzyme [Betaproteobacteria bacterium]|nr:SUMF1/EgtB/PvdO family nonheme iron enzyme [Betaproteobacteria bacterium]
MNSVSPGSAARAAREDGAGELAAGLRASRERTLALLAAYTSALGRALPVPYAAQLNPPLWEAGHIGWFQEYWIGRNRQRARGIACEPDHARAPGRLANADLLYDSSRVAHATRWNLPLPDLDATLVYLEEGLAESLSLLPRTACASADELYFFRLALFHEDMHAEAATYMAQALAIPLPGGLRAREEPLPVADGLRVPGGECRIGCDGPGFAFDNELAAHDVFLAAFEIDAVPVTWQRYLPFVESGGYRDARYWSAEGWRWLASNPRELPRYLRRSGQAWQRCLFGEWEPLPCGGPAVHLTWFEADAWCRWAGRRLPTEAEWEFAALSDARFAWGEVWEWTASRFAPYAGFRVHPYRDYSAPWFGTRQVLRGASRASAPRIAHPRYRNFFTPERNDIHAGFRSCAATP